MKETEIRRGRREDAAMKGGGKGKGTEPRRARLYLLPEGDVVLVQLADERGDAANEVRKDGRGEEHDADGEVALALRGGHDVTCATWQRGREVRGGVRAGGSPKDAPNVAREKLFDPSANPQPTSVTHAPPPSPPHTHSRVRRDNPTQALAPTHNTNSPLAPHAGEAETARRGACPTAVDTG